MEHLPSIRQLQYFLALDEHQHFGRAAAACYVSQSAFSHAIGELEKTLGTRLVDRTKRSVTITSTGRQVAEQARLCLQDMQSLVHTAKADQQPLTGPLILGVIPTIAPFLLPSIVPALRTDYPALELYLREDKTEDLLEKLHDGTLDAVMLALPWPSRNTETLELFQDPFLLAFNRHTRLVDPHNFSTDRLTANSVMLLEDGHCLREHTLSACRIQDLGTVNRFAASSLTTLLEMVNADLGVTFIPAMAIKSGSLRGTHITTLPMPDRSYRTIGLAWRAGSARADEFRLLGEFIRTHA